MRRLETLFAVLALTLISVVANSQSFVLIDLTAGSPYDGVIPNSINSSGQITGYLVQPITGEIDAFIYTNGSFQNLGLLGYQATDGTAINNSAQLAVDGEGPGVTALFYSNGQAKKLGSVDGGYTEANAINNLGDIVGSAVNGDGGRGGFSWIGGHFNDLSSYGIIFGWDINDSDQIVGTSGYYWTYGGFVHSNNHAFLLSGTTFTDLGNLTGNPRTDTEAFGINNSGQIVGYSTAADGLHHAFLYSSGTMQDLGTIGADYATAIAINSSGQIIGNLGNQYGASLGAFIYSNGAVTDLSTLIVSGGDGWSQLTVTGQNDSGSIVGYGTINGETHGFLLVPGSTIPTNLTFNPSSVTGGASSTGTVTISSPAPAGGLAVSLSSANTTVVQVPSSVTVSEGQTTATFTAITSAVQTNTNVTVTASVNGFSINGTIDVLGAVPNALSFNPSSVTGGVSSTGTVTISSPAPVGGLVVSLSSANTSVAHVPSSVTVPAGQTTATFTATTSPVQTNTNVNVTAAANGTNVATTLTVLAPVPTALSMNPSTVTGGVSSTGTVTISSPAPSGGLTISLASSNTNIVQVPNSVTVSAGQTSATFSATTNKVKGTSVVTLTASDNGVSVSSQLTVTKVALKWLMVKPKKIKGGGSVTGTVTLTSAPTSDVVVNLTSSDPAVAQTPASVTVFAGSKTATFTISTSSVGSTQTIFITGLFGGQSKSANLKITP